MSDRIATVTRTTKETDIAVTINLDGSGKLDIETGVPFFDHMLSGFAKHGLFDLTLKCKGDIQVDCHHTIEDCGIALGQAIAKALGDKAAIKRYGFFIIPMDETLVLSAVDLSGRPYLVFEEEYSSERVGDMDTEMVREFFYAVSYSAMMNLHIKKFSGSNNHHIAEASFKAFGRALSDAVRIEPRLNGEAWSTKGSLNK